MERSAVQLRCHVLYYASLRADRAFDRAIKRAFGPHASRWTLSYGEEQAVPSVRRAAARLHARNQARFRTTQVLFARAGGAL